jgi:hypothetical protein
MAFFNKAEATVTSAFYLAELLESKCHGKE